MLKVINVISDSNIGGAGRMLLVFLKNFDREKLDITVLLPEGAMLIDEISNLGVRCLTSAGLAEKSFDMQAVRRLTKLFKSEKPDIVHTHASMSARVAARLSGSKVVYTRHSVFPNSGIKTRFPLRHVIGGINNYFTDAVIAVSPAAKDIIVEAGQSPHKIEVIYNGVFAQPVPPPQERTAVRESYGLNDTDFVCGIFARLTPVKGHEYVLKAARRLSDKPDIKFVIAGTGESETELVRLRDEMRLENVVFTGFLSNVERLMGAVDLQLNASYGTEATSLALLEGMSMGIPAVVSSFGGNPYVITDGENGLVFPEKDDKALSEAILRIYSDKDFYKTLSENAVGVFDSRFTAETMTRAIERLYLAL